MLFPIEKIVPFVLEFGVDLTDEMISRLNRYGELLLEWNEKINLTAITDPEEIVNKHFYDCILFFSQVEVPKNASVIDVGTGAGFPGIVLKIVRPDIKLTLLDGLNKRLIFLKAVLDELGIEAELVHLRAEQGGREAKYRQKFDFATARAVAKMNVLCEYCLPFVKVGGAFVALKGPAANEELAQSQSAALALGGDGGTLKQTTLLDGDKRNFIIIKKISQTPPKYPRISAKISKQPL